MNQKKKPKLCIFIQRKEKLIISIFIILGLADTTLRYTGIFPKKGEDRKEEKEKKKSYTTEKRTGEENPSDSLLLWRFVELLEIDLTFPSPSLLKSHFYDPNFLKLIPF